jgi:uncharacterized SAM-binding protein YcdF (DUF218 family)
VRRSRSPVAILADAPPRPGRFRRHRRKIRRVLSALLVLCLAALAVFVWTAFRVWKVAREDHRGTVDAIVVLGASQFDGRPSPIFAARLSHAKELYDDGVAPRIMTLGGGAPGDRFTEGGSGARWLRDHGVPATAVTAVEEGRNTIDSLEAATPKLISQGVRSIVVVSDPWHSLRSRTIARDLGFTASTSPTRSGPAVRTRATQFRYILRETGAYLLYRTLGDVPHRKVPGAV